MTRADTVLWRTLAAVGILLGHRARATARQLGQARQGERRFLRHRRRVLRVYHRLPSRRV